MSANLQSFARERNDLIQVPASPLRLAIARELLQILPAHPLLTRKNIQRIAEVAKLTLAETDQALADLIARGDMRRDARNPLVCHRVDLESEVSK
jgi:hypothetical protein